MDHVQMDQIHIFSQVIWGSGGVCDIQNSMQRSRASYFTL